MVWDRDKTETFDFQPETRSRSRPILSNISTRPRRLETQDHLQTETSRPRLHPCRKGLGRSKPWGDRRCSRQRKENMKIGTRWDRDETETFDFQYETRSRPIPYHISTRPRRLETTSQDHLQTETSRPRLHPCRKALGRSEPCGDRRCSRQRKETMKIGKRFRNSF